MATAAGSATGGIDGQGFVVLPGEGKSYPTLGSTTTLLARQEETGGACEVIETTFPPGNGIPPHRHRQTDEATYVVAGEVTIQVGDRTVAAPAGSLAVMPRGTVHAFQNTGGAPARVLIWAMPRFGPGMQQVLEAFAQLPPGPPDPAQLVPMLERFDMELVAPPGN